VRRNVCGIAQVSPHASKAARTAPALLLWSHIRSGSRWAGAAKTYPLAPSSVARAASCSTSPVRKVQPSVGRLALGAAQVDASELKVDVLPPNPPCFVDPGSRSCQECNEICSRAPACVVCGDSIWLASRNERCLEDVVSFGACHGRSVVALL
jgi:hypothetical protein